MKEDLCIGKWDGVMFSAWCFKNEVGGNDGRLSCMEEKKTREILNTWL